ncbi:Conserved hypothetical protein [Clostridium acetobutylicum EA 2018]|uniref:Uncharacterized protein n=1 Tax=Clostridium acetobutylicum (strain ATCC 824 / DSM 792 / JCM 1419 / IAM 19013 / LMG 5710 / NBRC 13948 / NRRL B-527 / VKM B-1787 / 2291 / W) TaxID=272562 RepID=Q97HI4_CLOAB|nr:Hypothetical protein CA_C2027 [Clostridium acetobutylicum ATCC 824]ADZ21078.1 Conserved hypothetical protein [Clostridium acetobutylicum EA 2018]AEI32134.1 hypothetical protein SMB_G2059 [Clostridium acetobutylicum DSM 1731]AWV79584.1 hypothetical protein DK921_05610 [Clostridium acetobutylicum]PSM07544.1 hypothetical protein C7T89_05610 [Clostridium sp. NJ4]
MFAVQKVYCYIYKDRIIFVGIIIDKHIFYFKKIKKVFINLFQALSVKKLELRNRGKC